MQTETIEHSSKRLKDARRDFDSSVVLSEPFPGSPPLWIEPANDLLRGDISAASEWMIRHNAAIERALLSFGAVVWRGFAVSDTDDFLSMMAGFEPFAHGYSGGTSDRKAIKGKAMEATRTPERVYIQLHQEMSYMPHSPRALAFFCKHPSETGGETVICDMRGVLEELPTALRDKIAQCGAQYVRNLRSADVDDWRARPEFRHATWQYWFETEDRDEIASKLKERGADHSWNDDGSLTFITRTPAVRLHPQTDDMVFFNQLNSQIQNSHVIGEEREALLQKHYSDHTAWPYAVGFGNGDPVAETEYLAIRDVLEERKVCFGWQAGDVMLLENTLTAHGRHPYTGQRDVQVMLFD